MRDNTKRTIGGHQEQPKPKKPNVNKPFCHSGSSFQPWKKPLCKKRLDMAHANHHLTNSNISIGQCGNNINIVKSTPNHAEKNLFKGRGETSKVGGGEKAARINEVRGGKLDMEQKRLKRVLSNRVSAQRSRIKKNMYQADLEEKEKMYQSTITLIKPQIAAYENHKHQLLFEHHKLKLQMAIIERDRLLKEVEIEKNKAEVDRLSELYKKLAIEKQARMMNSSVPYNQLMPNSNLNPYGFKQFICLNSNQAQNGAETSRMQRYIGQQPQNQSQVWMDNRNSGHRSIPDLNLKL